MKSGTGSSVFAAALYEVDFLAVSKRQMAVSSSRVVLYCLQDVLEETKPLIGMLHGRVSRWKSQKSVKRLRSSDVWWNSKSGQLPRSLAGLIQSYSDSMATSLKFNALVAFRAYVVWSSFTEGERAGLVHTRYNLV